MALCITIAARGPKQTQGPLCFPSCKQKSYTIKQQNAQDRHWVGECPVTGSFPLFKLLHFETGILCRAGIIISSVHVMLKVIYVKSLSILVLSNHKQHLILFFLFISPFLWDCFHTFTFSSPPSLLFKHRLTANLSISNQPLYFFFLWRNVFMCVARSPSSLKTACLKICVIAHIYITRCKTGWNTFQNIFGNLCFTFCFV